MPLIWFARPTATGHEWAAQPLVGAQFQLTPGAARPVSRDDGAPGATVMALLVRQASRGAPESWALRARPGAGLRLNGAPLRWSLAPVNDRDEILLPDGQRVFFSTERLAEVVPFPGADHPVYCARCKTEIKQGALAVCCPACATWCHQSVEFPCWRYPGTSSCPLCDQPNDPEAGYRWSPEGL